MDDALRSGQRVRHTVRGRAIALGRDVLVAASILRTLHADASAKYTEDAETQGLIVQFGSLSEPLSAADRLGMSYKVLFVFVRAYQDAIYAVLFEQLQGARAGQSSSMRNAATNARNPVGAFLTARLPGYIEWFNISRALRNEIKEGARFALVGPQDDLGVGLTALDDAGGTSLEFRGDRILKLRDAAMAVGATKLVTELVLEVASANP